MHSKTYNQQNVALITFTTYLQGHTNDADTLETMAENFIQFKNHNCENAMRCGKIPK